MSGQRDDFRARDPSSSGCDVAKSLRVDACVDSMLRKDAQPVSARDQHVTTTRTVTPHQPVRVAAAVVASNSPHRPQMLTAGDRLPQVGRDGQRHD
jgi:hypothetical protein